ncbi:hypothetical protein SAMN05216573_102438 [Bradyrhizobium sp. Rc3b]|nr:hypothetical protein [Bradyrhizobium sp. SBR1B]SFM54784.1 hypothetical protein SAMN05216573_102438 [Bradyrhizobium sp. Rc3b]
MAQVPNDGISGLAGAPVLLMIWLGQHERPRANRPLERWEIRPLSER